MMMGMKFRVDDVSADVSLCFLRLRLVGILRYGRRGRLSWVLRLV